MNTVVAVLMLVGSSWLGRPVNEFSAKFSSVEECQKVAHAYDGNEYTHAFCVSPATAKLNGWIQ